MEICVGDIILMAHPMKSLFSSITVKSLSRAASLNVLESKWTKNLSYPGGVYNKTYNFSSSEWNSLVYFNQAELLDKKTT